MPAIFRINLPLKFEAILGMYLVDVSMVYIWWYNESIGSKREGGIAQLLSHKKVGVGRRGIRIGEDGGIG